MADNTKIVITAEDKTGAALASVRAGLGNLQGVAGALIPTLGALGGALTLGGAAAMVKGTIDAADGMNDLTQKVGIGVRELAGWTLAANQSGTSMESMAKGIKSLSVYMVENREQMKAAGITATDANGALIQLADMFKAMPDGVEKTALAVQLMGKAGMDLIPVMNLGSEGLATAFEKADAYGKKLAELAPQADKFNDQMEELALHSKAAGVNITSYFIPGLIGLTTWLNDVASGGKKAWNALAWIVGGLPEGVTLGDDAAPKAPSAAPVVVDPAKLREKAGKTGGAKTPLQRMLDAQQKRLAEINAQGGDEQMVSVDSVARQYAKQEEDALEKRRIAMEKMSEERMEAYRIDTEGEEAVREQMEKTTSALKDQKSIADDLGLTFASAFEDAVIGGKKLSDVLSGLAKDVARVFLRKTVTEPLADMAGSFFKDMLKPNAAGGVYASPSLSAYSGGIYNTPRMFAFANGAGIFGEAGAEAIMPLKRGANGRLGVEASGGGGTVNNVSVVVNAEGGRSQGDSTQAAELGRRIESAVRAVLMAEKRPRGLLGAG